LGYFVIILAIVLLIAIAIRVIFSLINFDTSNPLSVFVQEITEPILAPIRQFMPRIGMLDLSPMVAYFVLILIIQAAQRLLLN